MIKAASQRCSPIVLFIFALTLIISLIYVKSVFYELIFLDDDTLIYVRFVENNFFNNVYNSFTTNYLGGHYYRPFMLVSILLDSEITRSFFATFHLSNLLLHLATSILIFFIIKNLGNSFSISFLTVLTFSITPIHINAIGWIAGRGDLLAAFFSSVAFLFFLRYLRSSNAFLIIIVALLLLFATLSKEASLLVPFLFLFFYFVGKRELSINKNTIGILFMVIIVFSSYYFLRYILQPGVFIDKFSFTVYYKNILVLPETISKFFIPYGIKALPSFDLLTSISGTIIIMFLISLPFKISSINKSRYYFGLFWFIILLLPGMVFRTMEQDGFYYWDCRSYLPSIGLSIMVAEILRTINFQKHRIFKYTIITVYLFFLITTSFIKIDLYKNPINYWNSVKANYPNRFLPYLGLHNYYNHLNDFKNAEEQLLDGIKIKPEEFSIRQTLINFYLNNNEKQKAFTQIKDAVKNKIVGSVDLIENYISLAVELDKFNEVDELISEYPNDIKVRSKIKEIIISKAEQLNNTGDINKSNLLLKINRKLK